MVRAGRRCHRPARGAVQFHRRPPGVISARHAEGQGPVWSEGRYFLAETFWVLDSVYDPSRARIATAVEMLLNHRELSLQDADGTRSNSRIVSCWRLRERPVTCRLARSTVASPSWMTSDAWSDCGPGLHGPLVLKNTSNSCRIERNPQLHLSHHLPASDSKSRQIAHLPLMANRKNANFIASDYKPIDGNIARVAVRDD